MKILIAALLLAALGCGSTKYALRDSPSHCSQPCDASVTCTPDGNCLIECTGPDGATCRIELACDGATCRVVDSDCSQACASSCATSCPTK